MESYGPLVPVWVQAIVIALVIFVLGKYGHAISLKWAGIAWGVICLTYILMIAFKVEYFYNIASTIVGAVSATFFYKDISVKSKMPKAANIVSFASGLIWIIVFMLVVGWIFNT
ncbi:hypothetical protein [Lactobacillus kitasatonis]|uniref:hypothetical protein n=1 Tax=Lactobacillus kitasatonis TaxID=237446 RepID=UPI0026EC43EB|nr:hypothetical protein [Lactobacillus kitasatonis]